MKNDRGNIMHFAKVGNPTCYTLDTKKARNYFALFGRILDFGIGSIH